MNIGLLVYFRIVFGGIMCWEALRYLTLGRIPPVFQEPQFFFTYFGFSWVHPWGGDGMYYHFIAMAVLAVMVSLGLFYRLATTLLFIVFTQIFLIDQSYYLNHFYLISQVSLVMIFLPCHRACSVDALIWPKYRTLTVPTWPLWLLRFQIAVPYFFGGVAKINSDWLRGEPMRMWLTRRMEGLEPPSELIVYGMSYGGMLFDLLIVPALLWRVTRVPAILAAFGFHFANDNLFHIGVFPWFMVGGTLLFCPPEWMQVEEKKSAKQSKKNTSAETVLPAASSGYAKFVTVAFGAWVAFQCLMPFRHWLYPGNVSWTEEGHRFSWHMKLRDKQPYQFYAEIPVATGEILRWELVIRANRELQRLEYHLRFRPRDVDGNPLDIEKDPMRGVVKSHQLKGATVKPDMLLQLVQEMANRARQAGYDPQGIYVTALVRLNGRRPQPLIDSEYNLLNVDRSLATADWILPLTIPLSDKGETVETSANTR